MSKTTRATQALEKLGVRFTLHTYDYDPEAENIGLQAAEALGVEPHRMLKTLMAEVDGRPVCAVVPADAEVSMKKLASAFGAKTAKMMRPADAERLTGYHVGGISPFGQKKRVPVAIEAAALGHAAVFLNGGQRGLQVELDPNDAVKGLGAIARPRPCSKRGGLRRAPESPLDGIFAPRPATPDDQWPARRRVWRRAGSRCTCPTDEAVKPVSVAVAGLSFRPGRPRRAGAAAP